MRILSSLLHIKSYVELILNLPLLAAEGSQSGAAVGRQTELGATSGSSVADGWGLRDTILRDQNLTTRDSQTILIASSSCASQANLIASSSYSLQNGARNRRGCAASQHF